MAKVEVHNGDLEDALYQFTRSSEGSVAEYKRQLAFTSPAEQRRKKEHAAELKRKSRERRKLLRREAYRNRRREN